MDGGGRIYGNRISEGLRRLQKMLSYTAVTARRSWAITQASSSSLGPCVRLGGSKIRIGEQMAPSL